MELNCQTFTCSHGRIARCLSNPYRRGATPDKPDMILKRPNRPPESIAPQLVKGKDASNKIHAKRGNVEKIVSTGKTSRNHRNHVEP